MALLSHCSSVIDQIRVEGLEVRARVGVTEGERANPQRIVCTVTMWPIQKSDFQDDIANTLDYSAMAQAVKSRVDGSEFRLIETMAENIAGHVLEQFRARKVMVELRKFVLSDAQFVAVTALREKAAS